MGHRGQQRWAPTGARRVLARMSPQMLELGPLSRVAAGAGMISTAAVFVKLAAEGAGVSAIGAWRCLLGAMFLFPLLAVWNGAVIRPSTKALGYALLAGLFFAVDLYLWHRAIVIVGAGVATILANTQVFWTTALSRLLFGTRISARFVVAVGLAFAGVVLLVGAGSGLDLGPSHRKGVAFGLGPGSLTRPMSSRSSARGPFLPVKSTRRAWLRSLGRWPSSLGPRS